MRGPKSTQNVSCSRATPRLHRCNLGVALEQEILLGLFGPRPKILLAPSPVDFRGNPGIRALYQAIGIPILRPFRTQNTTTLESVVVCCCRRSLLQSVPLSCPFPWQTSISGHTMQCFAFHHSESTLRTELPLRSSFSAGGSLGKEAPNFNLEARKPNPNPEIPKNTAFTRSFSRSSHQLLPSSQ